MEKAKTFKVPTVEEMEEADEHLLKEVSKKHFKQSTTEGATSSKIEAINSSESGINRAVQPPSDPFAILKSSVYYEAALDEYNEMVQLRHQETATTSRSRGLAPTISNKIIVNHRQHGNPVLKGICNVPWEFGDIIPDYIMSRISCALFLSVRYHSLHPSYILERIKQLGNNYELRVLLVQVDVKDPHHALNQLMMISINMNMTLMLAWSPEEAGRHLETYKMFQNKPPDSLMKKQEASSYAKIIDSLTSVKSINRSDAVILLENFKTLNGIINASIEQISFCPGLGIQKAKRLHSVLHENFLKPVYKVKD